MVRRQHRSPRQELERVRVGGGLGLDEEAPRLQEPWGCRSQLGGLGKGRGRISKECLGGVAKAMSVRVSAVQLELHTHSNEYM